MLDRRTFMLGALAASFAGLRAYADVPSDAAIQAILQECVGNDRESTGIVAVVSGSAGSRLFTYGASGAADNRQLDGDTVFEIASITKVLTALILAAMVERGRSRDERSGSKIPAPFGEGSGIRRGADYAARSRHLHLWSADYAG